MIDRSSLSKIENIILDNLLEENIQNQDCSIEEAFYAVVKPTREGNALAVEKNNFVFLITPINQWLAKGDIFSSAKSHNVIEAAIETTKYIFESTTTRKIFGFTPNPKFYSLAMKTGWKKEGILSDSFWDGDKFVDQVIIGTDKKYFLEFLENRNK
jgi:hypothetical protein